MVPGELANELLELKLEYLAETEAREKETTREEKRKLLNKLHKKIENTDPNIESSSLIENTAHGTLSANL